MTKETDEKPNERKRIIFNMRGNRNNSKEKIKCDREKQKQKKEEMIERMMIKKCRTWG